VKIGWEMVWLGHARVDCQINMREETKTDRQTEAG